MGSQFMALFKYLCLVAVYLWLRFDLILRLAFGNNWKPRYEFMAQIFGPETAEKFLAGRVKLQLERRPKSVPVILPSRVDRTVREFLRLKPNSRVNRSKRQQIIKQLIHWATDPEINRENIDSYQTRSAIAESLLNIVFHNSLYNESELILTRLEPLVFSRVTYLGKGGEPSPIVHEVILKNVAALLRRHFAEVIRLRDQLVDKMTTVQLIKELNKSRGQTGSLAFSAGPVKYRDEFRHKFPLSSPHVLLLYKILEHYTFSGWPESREKAKTIVAELEAELNTDLKSLIIKTQDG